MEKAADENYDDFIEVEQDYRLVAVEAYIAKEIRLADLMATLCLKRSQTIRKVKRFKAEGAGSCKSCSEGYQTAEMLAVPVGALCRNSKRLLTTSFRPFIDPVHYQRTGHRFCELSTPVIAAPFLPQRRGSRQGAQASDHDMLRAQAMGRDQCQRRLPSPAW